MSQFKIKLVNYQVEHECANLIMLLNEYAIDPMGGGTPLSDTVKTNLIDKLAKHGLAYSFIVYADTHPISLANCFITISTFHAKPLLNIHDLIVLPAYRGQGVIQKLLTKVEQFARNKGCCKLTLEVLASNQKAQGAYKKFGFTNDCLQLNQNMGTALFWQKNL